MRRTLVAVLLVSSLALPFAVPAGAQAGPPAGFKACGNTDELVLVFMNPDLVADETGIIHASGRFFIQFQARGPAAFDIDKLYFSFGKPVPGSPAVCDTPEWYTEGAFLKNYRADLDPSDGFFVPINTYNVGDGDYIAALSAYDAAGNELVRYWATAVVENGCDRPCSDEEDLHVASDKVQPWPMILPGDGARFDGKDGLYLEVAEPVKEVKAWLGTHEGQKLLTLDNATPPNRDDDVVPDVNAAGQGQQGTLDCPVQLPAQCAKPWGQAWEWAGVVGEEAVVRVRLVDLNGNVAEKVVHVGDPTIGGRVTGGVPELQFDLAGGEEKTTDAEGRAVWNVTYRSVNDDGVHGDVFVRNPDGTNIASSFRARLSPNHVMMGGKEQREGTVEIVAGPEVRPGKYDFQLVVDYLAGAERVQKSTTLRLDVVDRSAGPLTDEPVASEAGEQVEGTRGESIEPSKLDIVPEEVPKSTPGAAFVLVAAGVAAAAFLRRK